MAPLKLVDVGEGRLLHADEREAFERFKRPKAPAYSLVGSIDGIVLLRRDLPSLLDDGVSVPSVRGVADLPDHAIVDRGQVIGLWEYDPAAQEIVWMTFGKPDKALRAEVARTGEFVRDQLGDARSMSLDSPKSRQGRIQAIRRKVGGQS